MSLLLLLLACGVSIPALVVAVECFAAISPRRRPHSAKRDRPAVAVLVPAHNEAERISPSLVSLLDQLSEGDRLLVVAHNCDDATAEVARRHGAEVLELDDRERWGKGHALAVGVEQLATDPRPMLLILDADDVLARGALDRLALAAQERQRPVQGARLLSPPPAREPALALRWLAYHLKVFVRPLGLSQLGLPCLLTGSGVVIPWELVRRVPLASDRTAQDLELSIALAHLGAAPAFCAEAEILTRFPVSRATRASQDRRWAPGHLAVLRRHVPALLASAARQRSRDLAAIALDLAVPPSSLLLSLWLAALGVALGGCWLGWGGSAAAVLLASGATLSVALFVAWARHGRGVVRGRTLLFTPAYVLSRAVLYTRLALRSPARWLPDPDAESDETRSP